jgi:hypothetical protein
MSMLAEGEPARDRWLWGCPALSRPSVHTFDPAGADMERVVAASVAALRLGEYGRARDLSRLAYERARDDPTIRTLLVWAEILRAACCFRPRPTDAQVGELTELAESSAFARYALIRALLLRGDLDTARYVLDTSPEALRGAPSIEAAAAVVLLHSGGTAEALRRLRGLRARWAPWRGLVNLEVVAALRLGDRTALEEAYSQRCMLLGRKPLIRVLRAWARVPFAEVLAGVALGIALAAGWRWAMAAGLLAVVLEAVGAHIMDWRPGLTIGFVCTPALLVGAAFVLPPQVRTPVGSVAAAIALAAYAALLLSRRRYRRRAAGDGRHRPIGSG